MSLSSADCKFWLATDPDAQIAVADRSGLSDYQTGDATWNEVQTQWVLDGKRPDKWKRQRKMKVGSKADLASGCPYGDADGIAIIKQIAGIDPTGGVRRVFWLEGTDSVQLEILEVDDKLYITDDLGD